MFGFDVNEFLCGLNQQTDWVVKTTFATSPRKPRRIPRSWIRARRRRGVTLIELLVWGAVIWLVFLVVMP